MHFQTTIGIPLDPIGFPTFIFVNAFFTSDSVILQKYKIFLGKNVSTSPTPQTRFSLYIL